jgi:hypothetical protein
MILATITPNNYLMPFEAAKCWIKVLASGKYGFTSYSSPYVYFNRNKILKSIKDEHLLMIDSDIIFTLEQVEKMEQYLEQGYDAITGIYNMGTPPYKSCIFERTQDDYEPCEVKEGLNEIGACGGGFLAVNKDTLKALPEDPFNNIQEGNVFHGEDISFCHRLHELGFKIWADSNIKLGHLRLKEV